MSHDGEAPQAVEPLDRKAVLTEQFNEVEAQQSETPAQEPTQQARARDEAGKFVPKDKAAPVEASPIPVAPAEPWAAAPKSWKKELAEGWGKLDPAYQRYVHERETQMHAGIQPLLPKAELADQITKVAEPYMATIRGLGIDLPYAVATLLKTENDLRTLPYEQKLMVLQQIAASYGVDLSGQLQNAQQNYNPLIANLQNKVMEIEGRYTSLAQQQEAADQFAAQQEIQGFAKTAEHFEDVKPMMIRLLQGGFAGTIEEAYNQAVRLDPNLFDSMSAAKQAQADADKRKAANDAAQKAKAAAVSVKTATPGSKTPTNAQDRRSILREQIEGLSERL